MRAEQAVDLVARLADRLADLGGQRRRERLDLGRQRDAKALHHLQARAEGRGRPRRLRGTRGAGALGDEFGVGFGDFGDQRAGRGVVDLQHGVGAVQVASRQARAVSRKSFRIGAPSSCAWSSVLSARNSGCHCMPNT